jgi:hypothetical protein
MGWGKAGSTLVVGSGVFVLGTFLFPLQSPLRCCSHRSNTPMPADRVTPWPARLHRAGTMPVEGDLSKGELPVV